MPVQALGGSEKFGANCNPKWAAFQSAKVAADMKDWGWGGIICGGPLSLAMGFSPIIGGYWGGTGKAGKSGSGIPIGMARISVVHARFPAYTPLW